MNATLGSVLEADLLQGLSAAQAAELTRIARRVELRHGEYLAQLGDQADTIFVIERGVLELTVPIQILGEEKNVVSEELMSGSSLAWSAMIPPHALTMSARAATAATLVGFSRNDLLRIFEARPDIGYRVMTNLAAVVGHRLQVTKAMWLRELQRAVKRDCG